MFINYAIIEISDRLDDATHQSWANHPSFVQQIWMARAPCCVCRRLIHGVAHYGMRGSVHSEDINDICTLNIPHTFSLDFSCFSCAIHSQNLPIFLNFKSGRKFLQMTFSEFSFSQVNVWITRCFSEIFLKCGRYVFVFLYVQCIWIWLYEVEWNDYCVLVISVYIAIICKYGSIQYGVWNAILLRVFDNEIV